MFKKYFKNITGFTCIGMVEFISSDIEGSNLGDFESMLYFNKKKSACFVFEVLVQKLPSYCLKEGAYAVRYLSKKTEICSYTTTSSIPELNSQKRQFANRPPWPEKQTADIFRLGIKWHEAGKNRYYS